MILAVWLQENSTEVPPSPASVCSSAHDEFTRPGDHPSPVFTLDVPLIEDHHMPQVFKEISSNLHGMKIVSICDFPCLKRHSYFVHIKTLPTCYYTHYSLVHWCPYCPNCWLPRRCHMECNPKIHLFNHPKS